MRRLLYIVIATIIATLSANAQNGNKPVIVTTDSTTSVKTPALTKDTIQRVVGKDTVKIIPKHDPKKATFRSAVLPGWGQAYNREYWKIPLVYAAIGIPAGFWVYNNSWYKKTKNAYEIRVANDTARFGEIDPKIEPLSVDALRYYRNSFRRDRDYSVLYFFIAWGVNVIDATVFGHLKDFDVSPDLTMHITPTFKPSARGSTTGLSLVLAAKSPAKNHLTALP
jgi:hypothetical protein